jgi:hypothetical protein
MMGEAPEKVAVTPDFISGHGFPALFTVMFRLTFSAST